jgi:RNA 3'-terminal phosphate cyclase (ATP)
MMEKITIDGSIGEGGGQILRTAIALSSILQKDIRITNIRKSRPRPGLGLQHVKSIELAAALTGAVLKGVHFGSTEVEFMPGQIKSGDFSINMGTAGSITLALQSVLPIAAYAPGPVVLDITGGTDVKWAPPYDYFKNVIVPALKLFGYDIGSTLIKRGYFPIGNGQVIVNLQPAKLYSVDLTSQKGNIVNGISSSSRLPPHVATRQSKAAREYLESCGYEIDEISLDLRNDSSIGSSITLFSGLMGGSALGERGLPAERVGRIAAESLVEELKTGAAVDEHLADQLIIYMALADGCSNITCSKISGHTLTGIGLVELMTGKKFNVSQNKISVIRS